ncbi:MAG: protein kinase [Deltaproteobacteria bacterium]|nr:protein kinase [Deltaproteobacteria bacterium]
MAIKAKRTSHDDPYIGKVVAGRYRLETRLGEGGMGIVYRARHVLIDRVVALKIIRPDLRSETHLRQWMLREARAANRVDHAHIVQIYDIGETETNELYLVMEYLVGISLASICAKGPLAITRAVDILEQMCAALTRAHDLGVIHRDLKSDNIMLTVQGGRKDFVKILDFGLAALARDARLAPKGAVFGTPEYMAPEQARGEDATNLCDLYALGVLFFEMVTGELPFRSNDRETLLEMQRSAPAPRPSSLQRDVAPQVDEIVLKLLEKDPTKRFRDGHHLQEELKSFQRSLPTHQWEKLEQNDQPPAQLPPPPAPTPGVQEWGTRAANFARMLARGYPNGKAPEEIQQAVDTLWDLAARASRLEGELASHTRRLESIRRRGRALRAEIGRKVEGQAADESRALREASADRSQAAMHKANYEKAAMVLEEALKRAEQMAGSSADIVSLRDAFEAVGHARATVAAHENQYQAYTESAIKIETHAANLRKQIEELRGELQHYSDALENDLNAGRELIAKRVESAINYEKKFLEASTQLINHFRELPECRDLLKELSSDSKNGQGWNREKNDAMDAI